MTSYHDLPLLKGPVWTWEVPLYFFAGGAAGAAAVIGEVARLTGAGESLVRDARWIAAIGANASAPLLISDLGRPERFLNMMRVFKPQSPMSVGAWTLAVFGGASTTAIVPLRGVRTLAAVVSAGTGLLMMTYTGVLLGASAIPAWKAHVKLLPANFGASALGAAVGLLELRGHRQSALNSLGLGVAVFESLAAIATETGDDRASKPLRESALLRAAGALSGPVPLLLRLFGKRKAAAAAQIAGSLLTRFAWVEAGKASARDVHAALGDDAARG